MRATIYLDKELRTMLEEARKHIREKDASILRMAIRTGLPIETNWHRLPAGEKQNRLSSKDTAG
jgi:hypothetical protein